MFKPGALLVTAMLGIAAAPMSSPAPNRAEISHQQKPGQAAQTAQPAQPDERGTERHPLIVETHSRPKREAEATKAEEDRHEESINSQIGFWTMVSAIGTALLFIGAIFQIALFVWQLKLIRESLDDTKEAADAAKAASNAAMDQAVTLRHTLELSKQTSERELRAYISIEPAGIIQLIGRHLFSGQLVIRNVGKLPASLVHIRTRMHLSETSDFSEFADGQDMTFNRTIAPGVIMRRATGQSLPLKNIEAAPNGFIFVWGEVRYSDGFDQRRISRFCHRYSIASRNRGEDYVTAPQETRVMIGAEKARYYHFNNDSD